jgi:hypothetical protein
MITNGIIRDGQTFPSFPTGRKENDNVSQSFMERKLKETTTCHPQS